MQFSEIQRENIYPPINIVPKLGPDMHEIPILITR